MNSNNIWQKNICKNGVIDQGKCKKIFMERKWTDRKYHVQDNADLAQKYLKIYCNKNQFPELPFCVPHSKPHGARGLSKNYHLRFDPKLGNCVCAIFCIPCACVACTSMLDKPWISSCQFPCSQNCETRNFFTQNMPETIDWLESQSTQAHWLESQSTWFPDVGPSTNGKTIWLESYLTWVTGICPSTDNETIWLES